MQMQKVQMQKKPKMQMQKRWKLVEMDPIGQRIHHQSLQMQSASDAAAGRILHRLEGAEPNDNLEIWRKRLEKLLKSLLDSICKCISR